MQVISKNNPIFRFCDTAELIPRTSELSSL